MRLFTCGQAHNEACKCTADQNLSLAKVKTNLGKEGEEGCTCPVCGQTHPATARYNRVNKSGKRGQNLCLRLSTTPAVAAKRFSLGIQNKLHSPTEWASWIPSNPKRNSRYMCADFAAHGRPGLSNRECHWIAPVFLAAVQPGPWLPDLVEINRKAP